MASSGLYQYEPVARSSRDFRLIRLLPSEAGTWLRGPTTRLEIITASLDAATNYDALSYTWNSDRASRRRRWVVVEKDKARYYLPISNSLLIALQHLQDAQRRPIFVDQLCINQTDVAEKEHQVELMADIYAQSTRVVIWLGPGSRQSDAFFSYVAEMGSQGVLSRVMGPRVAQFMNVFDAVMNPANEVTPSEREDRDDLLRMIEKYGSRFPLLGMSHVLQMPWFNRVWTLQEACLARQPTFVCGRRSLCFECFRGGMLFFNVYNTHWVRNLSHAVDRADLRLRNDLLDQNVVFRRIFQERKAIHTSGRHQTMYDIILRYNVNGHNKKIGVTLRHDRIFALLGLAAKDDELRTRIKVDYTHDARHVYSEIAALILHQKMDGLLFVQGSRASGGLPGLPSWVPDWSIDLYEPHGYGDGGNPEFDAGGEISKGCTYNSGKKTMTIPGLLVDTIVSVGTHLLKTTYSGGVKAQVEYHTAQLLFDEALEFSSRASAGSPDSIRARAAQLADGALTVRYMEKELGIDEGRREFAILHDYVHHLGLLINVTNDTRLSTHMGRVVRASRSERRYWLPAPERELLMLCATSPKEAGTLLAKTARDIVGDIATAALLSARVMFGAWHISLRSRFSKVHLRPSDEKRQKTMRDAGLDRFAVRNDLLSVFLSNLVKNANRRLYRTRQGHVGLGPVDVKPGDAAVVFFGGTVPHILRQNEGADTWRYVGEAYVDSLMDGEALGPGRFEERAFTLR